MSKNKKNGNPKEKDTNIETTAEEVDASEWEFTHPDEGPQGDDDH